MHRLTTQSVLAGCCAGALAAAAQAQQGTLRQDQVLVVYDSRVNDSLRVAEYYAGSAKVPGGVGGLAGARPYVRVVDTATITGWVSAPGEINYALYINMLRDPLRTWLNANDPRGYIRCLVLPRGISYRIQDSDSPIAGDNPTTQDAEFSASDATGCSVDSELTLVQRSLDHQQQIGPVTEAGGPGDSYADGIIANPYHNGTLPVTAWSTVNRKVNRAWNSAAGLSPGQLWVSKTTPAVQVFTPGDYYLVCRLDGNTLADVFTLIDRGRQNYVNLATSVVVLDEGDSNGVADANPATATMSNFGELDNDALTAGSNHYLWLGDDFERTRDFITGDGRLLPANLRYDSANAPGGLIVGPRINFGGGALESRPVLLLASEANNANLPGHGSTPGTSGSDLPLSFNWAPMGLYNSTESFNGRKFGGLSAWIGQSQIADAISAGASFGLCNVQEPFAFALPDNEPMAKRFYFGRLSFAEAAYTAIGGLSWQTIAVGDPLARVQRSTEDINGDLRVDVNDLYAWEVAPTNVNHLGSADDTDRQMVDQSPRPVDHIDMAGFQRP